MLIIGGPTATGKSSLALYCAERYHGAIINADSLQQYAALPLLAALPSMQDICRVEHYLYGYLAPHQSSSMAAWYHRAVGVIDALHAQQILPIIVGGTGLYLRALLEGIAPIPPVSWPLTQALRRMLEQEGPEALYAALAREDPLMAARLAPNDRQRVLRALGVWRSTGVSLDAWQRQPPIRAYPQARMDCIRLVAPRDWLYERCNTRAASMLNQGAIQEVASLLEQEDLPPDASILRTIGVDAIRTYLQQCLTLPERTAYNTMLVELQQATRQYAKRQTTWFTQQWQVPLRIMNISATDWNTPGGQKMCSALLDGWIRR